ncbi:hypothetical protein ABH994_008095 [Bradyrhizobium yuanmingense]|uniref:hypothetical protein n=1 Tax=Bradyrhizobium yuanmingense TaxID=108015 RepID=UPI0035179AF9
MTAIITAFLSAIAAFVESWLAARFALGRFRSEKIWERCAGAYSAVFAALHRHWLWYSTHQHALMHGKDLSKEETERLSAAYDQAQADIQTTLASETWPVSDPFRQRLDRLERELRKRSDDWFSHLENNESALRAAIDDLRTISREELKVPSDTLTLGG